MALETVSEWKRARETILDCVRQHPGCRMQDVAAKTKYTYEEIARAVEGMGRLERWESYGTQHLYVSGTHIPTPTRPAQHRIGHRGVRAMSEQNVTEDVFEKTIQGFIDNLSLQRVHSRNDRDAYFEGMKNAYRYALAAYRDTRVSSDDLKRLRLGLDVLESNIKTLRRQFGLVI